jgi:hypothetical protein
MMFKGRLTKTNTLTIGAHRFEPIGLGDTLFGSDVTAQRQKAVHVTRSQMKLLADEMYSTLSIIED